MGSKLSPKEESFIKAYVDNGGEASKAYRSSDYSQNLTAVQVGVQAAKLLKKPRISLRIEELMKKVKKIADEKFTVSVEQRLKWLEEVAKAGLGTYEDQQGNKRRENLAATKGAVEALNAMLGHGDDGDNEGDALTIQFNVAPAVGKVKVTNA